MAWDLSPSGGPLSLKEAVGVAATQAWKLQVTIGPPGVSMGLGAWH